MNGKRLLEELQMIKKLLAVNIIKGTSLKEQVKLLTEVGFSPKEISGVTGKSANLIRVTKFSLKNKEKNLDNQNGEEIENEWRIDCGKTWYLDKVNSY